MEIQNRLHESMDLHALTREAYYFLCFFYIFLNFKPPKALFCSKSIEFLVIFSREDRPEQYYIEAS